MTRKKRASTQVPSEYLQTHELTRMLEVLGVTNEQLQGMRFTPTNKERPFDQWSVTFLGSTPPETISLVKAYCALKWLILDNPSSSRDKDDAWRLVSETLAAPTFKIGENTSCSQSERAKRPRGKITDDGKTLGQVIRELALKPEYRRDTARDLWPHLRVLLGEDRDPKRFRVRAIPRIRSNGPTHTILMLVESK